MKDRVWWARPGFLAAGAFLLLVAVLAIWIATSRTRPSATGPAAGPTNGGEGGQITQRATSAPSSLAPLHPALPDTAPADVTWTLWHGIAMPASLDAGPHNIHDGIAEGYSQTPAGALLAADHITTRFTFGSSHTIAEKQLSPGAGRDAILARAKDGDGDTSGAPQDAGFKFVSYTGENAVLFLAVRTHTGQLQSGLVSLEWRDGDWRVVPTATGEIFSSSQALSSLAGYVGWSGVS